MNNQYIKKTRSHSKISEPSQPSLKKLKIEPKTESKKINFEIIKTYEDINRLTRQKKSENIKKPANTVIEIPISEKKKFIKPKLKNNTDKKENIRINLEKYTQAIERLQEYSLPDCIPCRESEKNSLEEFLIVNFFFYLSCFNINFRMDCKSKAPSNFYVMKNNLNTKLYKSS